MRTFTLYLLALLAVFITQSTFAQEENNEQITRLEQQKEKITLQEKEALKFEVDEINKRLENGDITEGEANELKRTAAEKRALNIENRIAILDNQIALLQRNEGKTLILMEMDTLDNDRIRFGVDIDGKPVFNFNSKRWKREIIYDRRTYSDFVIAVGLNNAIIEGESLDDSPYKIGGSRFFEMGWQWRTRVFKNSNFLRLNYGFSFQFNGLKPKDNQYFVATDDGQTELQEFDLDLKKSKLRMDNLVFPLHFEFGPSKLRKTEETMRYSLNNQFRLGIGGYVGFNLGTRQKLKYDRNGESVKDKLKRGYNTSNFVYGLSAYAGFDGVLLYVKYDLNPIFKDALVEQRNVSLGLRFDL